MAYIIILKQSKKVKIDHTDPITTSKSQKLVLTKIFKLKIFYLILLLIKLISKIIASIPSFFLLIPKNDDTKNSIIVYNCRYRLGSMFSLSKEKHIQFNKKNDRVSDIAKPVYCQKPISIRMRFQVESFQKSLIFLLV